MRHTVTAARRRARVAPEGVVYGAPLPARLYVMRARHELRYYPYARGVTRRAARVLTTP